MRTIEHTLRIETSPERVWQVLTDTGAYDRWNPFITRLDAVVAQSDELAAVDVAGRADIDIGPGSQLSTGD